MAKATMTVSEDVVVEYEIHYDEEKLAEMGYTSLEDYLARFDGNAWKAESEESVIRDISHIQILDYMETHHDTMEVTNG